MKLIIQTQHEENYGAHCWDGDGECPQYWKMKGGSTYVVRDVTATNIGGISVLVDSLSPLIESDNEAYREYIIDWSIVDDCESDGVMEWQQPWVITQVGGKFTATRRSEMCHGHAYVESYTMLPDGDRTDYSSVKVEEVLTAE